MKDEITHSRGRCFSRHNPRGSNQARTYQKLRSFRAAAAVAGLARLDFNVAAYVQGKSRYPFACVNTADKDAMPANPVATSHMIAFPSGLCCLFINIQVAANTSAKGRNVSFTSDPNTAARGRRKNHSADNIPTKAIKKNASPESTRPASRRFGTAKFSKYIVELSKAMLGLPIFRDTTMKSRKAVPETNQLLTSSSAK